MTTTRHRSAAARAARPAPAGRPERGLEQLFARILPPLRRWARGRLPRWARRRADTEDIVQDAAIGALAHPALLTAEPPRRVYLYLQQAVRNRIRDEIRRAQRGDAAGESADDSSDDGPSPLDQAIASQERSLYYTALERLVPEDQLLIVGRIDLKMSFETLARAAGLPSPDAARMAMKRAVFRLAREMRPAAPAPPER